MLQNLSVQIMCRPINIGEKLGIKTNFNHMDNSTQYIKKQLELWNKQFDGIHIKYVFDKEANFHIVEISPEEIRRGNDEYKQQELDFWMNFLKLYPNENLLISEPSDTNETVNTIYTNT